MPWPPLVRLNVFWTVVLYYSVFLRPVGLPLIQAHYLNTTFQQNNAWSQVSCSFSTFLNAENFRLLLWSARSSDLSPIENIRSMVADRLARYHSPVTTNCLHHVEQWTVGILTSTGVVLRDPSSYLLEFRRILRKTPSGVTGDWTRSLPVMRTELLGHWWGCNIKKKDSSNNALLFCKLLLQLSPSFIAQSAVVYI